MIFNRISYIFIKKENFCPSDLAKIENWYFQKSLQNWVSIFISFFIWENWNKRVRKIFILLYYKSSIKVRNVQLGDRFAPLFEYFLADCSQLLLVSCRLPCLPMSARTRSAV